MTYILKDLLEVNVTYEYEVNMHSEDIKIKT